ncbi:hypothetical protein UlMin_027208 [Ulmus minor]
MAAKSTDDFIIIEITNSDQIEAEICTSTEEIFISTTDIPTWDLPTILCRPTVKVRAHRSRLTECSSYFHGMLTWSFSESRLNQISIQWNLESFINILKCIYGFRVDVTLHNFLRFYELASSTEPPQIDLEDLISIWNFDFKNANNFLSELCASYLAKNFMWVISCQSFVDVPYDLLLSCIKHPYLTVESEMHLSDALIVWVDANVEHLEGLCRTEDDCTSILKQIRLSLLPVWFVAVKRRSCHFSKLAGESITSIFKLLEVPSTGSISCLGDDDLSVLRIRLTKYSKKVDLSSCPQITSVMLLLSLLPSVYSTDPTLIKCITQFHYPISRGSLPILTFETVQEVNISKCPRLNLEAAIECLSVSFPSLKILKAAYLLNFKMLAFRQLVQKCPMLRDVDLTIDITPIISEQVSNDSSTAGDSLIDVKYISMTTSMLSNITKIVLEGRNELRDSDILHISQICINLLYLNLKGCTGLSDVGMARLIGRCVRLQAILVSHTSFGTNSVLALCSSLHGHVNSPAQLLESLAFNLQTLHIGGCKGVDETSLLKLMSQTQMLRSLCLSGTHVTDRALYSFAGSSLEMLDVSNTLVSGAALAHIVYGNPSIKCLRMRDCRNLCLLESNAARGELSSLRSCTELDIGLGKICSLEEISLGWGFSHFSMEVLTPAITSLREITVGLGASVGEGVLIQLPCTCPVLESITLLFQVISDSILENIMVTLKNLHVLALSYCFGDISLSGFQFSMPNLRKLQLERVTPWLTNKDLVILTQNFPNLVEFSLLGCTLLNSDSQEIISHGWPGLLSIHLEECGEVTANGVSSLLNCMALEDLLLRHNGPGIQSSFVLDVASKLPMLRQVSLDLCDASEGYFDVPPDDERHLLCAVKIARCKKQKCGLSLQLLKPGTKLVHKDTLLLSWNSKNVVRSVVKERF